MNSNERILCVDDEPNILAAYQRNLRKQFLIDVATNGADALKLLETAGPYCVVVSDMGMPGMDGAQLLAHVAERHPDTVRIMLTGHADQHTAVAAVNEGHIFRFLSKPCPPEHLALALDAGLRQHRLQRAERDLLEKTLHGAVNVLSGLLAMVDPMAFGLGQELREDVRAYRKSIGQPTDWELEVAALLSQVGYAAVPQTVMKRWREGHGLAAEEKDMIARAPQVGSELLAGIPRLENVARIVLYQRKHFDGTGFPFDAVAGDDLPLGARLLKALVDLRELQERGTARASALHLLRERDGQYDPRILHALLNSAPGASDTAAALPHGRLKTVLLRELQAGYVLAAGVETKDGLLILPAGRRLSAVMIEKIRNFAVVSGVKEPLAVIAPF